MCEILKVQRAKAVEILFRREEKIQKHFLNIEENQAVCCPNQEHAAWFWLPPTVVDKPPKPPAPSLIPPKYLVTTAVTLCKSFFLNALIIGLPAVPPGSPLSSYPSPSFVIYAVQFLASMVGKKFVPGVMADANGSFIVLMLTMYGISMPFMGWLVSRIPAQKIEERKMTAGQWIIAFLMCYGLMYAGNLIGTALTFGIGMVKGTGVDNPLVSTVMQLNPRVTFIIAVLIAPTAEELLFRKLLTERIVKYGVLASGLFFGLFHGNLNQFSYAFLLGLFLGFIYVKTGKLRYTIGLHMAINFIGSSLGTWMLRVTGYMDTMETLTEFLNTKNLAVLADLGNGIVGMFIFGSYASLILMMAGAGLILTWLNRKKFVCCAPEEKVASLGKKKAAVMIGNPGILLYGAFWIGIMIWQLLQ